MMKQYVVDELRPADHAKLKAYLDKNCAFAELDGIYWITLDQSLLSGVQESHHECRPFYFALELLPQKLACELLVRTRRRIHCQCIQYATEPQRNWLIGWIDTVLEHLGISV
jgi:hypothetical protein